MAERNSSLFPNRGNFIKSVKDIFWLAQHANNSEQLVSRDPRWPMPFFTGRGLLRGN